MLIAGEASGDLLAAGAMEELKKHHPNATFIGIGGDKMIEQGLNSLFPMSELSLMGIAEVLPHIPKLLRRSQETTRYAQQQKPDLILTIDAPDFTLRTAKKIHKVLPHTPIIHYVSPSIWAWRRGRVHKMATFLTHVLALFPFEPQFYKNTSLTCTHVGHPVVRRLMPHTQKKTQDNITLAILPGSRTTECKSHWPTLTAIMAELRIEHPSIQFIIPIPNAHLKKDLFLPAQLQKHVTFLTGEERYTTLATCTAALTKSGTSNLELAVLGIPMVVFYKMNALTYAIAKHFIHIPYMSPVNWVLGKKAIPELRQDAFTPQNVLNILRPLLKNETAQSKQKDHLLRATQLLKGDKDPNKAVADILSSYLK